MNAHHPEACQAPTLFKPAHRLLLSLLLLGSALDASAQNTLTNGLVAYYPFNGNANDESGNGNNAVNSGAVLTVNRFGVANSAYSFDGISQMVAADSPSLRFITGTVSVWAKPSQASDQNTVLSKRCNIFGEPHNSYAIVGSGPRFYGVTGTTGASSTNDYTVNSWRHLVLAIRTNGVDFYENGILAATTINAGILPIPYSTLGFYIGNSGFPDNTQKFRGAIDDIRIYNRALSAAEVTQLYAAEAAESTIATLNLFPVLTLTGTAGDTYRIEATSDLVNTNVWTTLTNLTLPSSPFDFIDKSTPQPLRRFYRAIPVP